MATVTQTRPEVRTYGVKELRALMGIKHQQTFLRKLASAGVTLERHAKLILPADAAKVISAYWP